DAASVRAADAPASCRRAPARVGRGDLGDRLRCRVRRSVDLQSTVPALDGRQPRRLSRARLKVGERRMPENTELFEIIHTTRAMRRLKPDPVPEALIRKILEAGVCAPNGGNTQRWRFLVIKDPAI